MISSSNEICELCGYTMILNLRVNAIIIIIPRSFGFDSGKTYFSIHNGVYVQWYYTGCILFIDFDFPLLIP